MVEGKVADTGAMLSFVMDSQNCNWKVRDLDTDRRYLFTAADIS